MKVEKSNKGQWRERQQQAHQIKEFSSLISQERFNQFYIPKFFELCLDDVAQVREKVAIHATASILKSFLNSSYLQEFISQMKEFKMSNRYNYRQAFVCMIESIFLDFCDSANGLDLIQEIVVPYFIQDLIEISQDRVVNVRIQLAECFLHFS